MSHDHPGFQEGVQIVQPPASQAERLDALLGSRICHDLVSPLGAISNGLELLGLSGAPDSPEIALIRDAVDNANARLRLFRIAFGAASEGQSITASEVRAALAPALAPKRITLDWTADGDPSRAAARLVCLAALCAEGALAWGGTLVIGGAPDDWHLVATADRLRDVSALWPLLTDAGAGPVSSGDVHFPLARQAAAALGRTFTVEERQTEIRLSV